MQPKRTIRTVCPICRDVFYARKTWERFRQRYCSQHCFNISRLVPIEKRFWPKVNKTETCWLWTGSRIRKGYGTLWTGRAELAHRISWKIHNGPIPDGLNVLHHCDNPPCVRPDHLFLGTAFDNAMDKFYKGRMVIVRGEATGCAKLTENDVRQMRRLHAEGKHWTQIAPLFPIVSAGTVQSVIRRRSWRHVT